MNLQAEKLELMQLILESESAGLIKAAKNLFRHAKTDAQLWNSLPKEHRNEILEGLSEVESGQILDYNEFMQSHRK
jgi:hypothetical protein